MQGPMLQMLSGGFLQSVRMCLDALGFAEAEIVPTQEVAVASARIEETPIGPIEPGQVAARRFAWEARVGDRIVVRVAVNWLMGEEHLDPPWTLGSGGAALRGRGAGRPGHVRGDPRLAPHLDRGRAGAQPRHRRHGSALRELDPVRRGRRTRNQDLSRPAAGRRPCAPRPGQGGVVGDRVLRPRRGRLRGWGVDRGRAGSEGRPVRRRAGEDRPLRRHLGVLRRRLLAPRQRGPAARLDPGLDRVRARVPRRRAPGRGPGQGRGVPGDRARAGGCARG